MQARINALGIFRVVRPAESIKLLPPACSTSFLLRLLSSSLALVPDTLSFWPCSYCVATACWFQPTFLSRKMLFDLVAVSAAVLLNSRTAMAQNDEGTPCQSVSSMSAAFMSQFPSATAALVPAQAAEDCLKSVPVDVQENQALIEEMQYFIDWQSNLAWIENPPAGYTEKKADIQQQIVDISAKMKGYKDEYSVQKDLNLVIAKAYDFHFVWNPDIINVFRFRRGNIGRGLLDEFAIVSVSEDGKKLPVLYNYCKNLALHMLNL